MLDTTTGTITIERSEVTPEIARLAALDSAPCPAGPMLVASVDGVACAALPVGGGRVIADPFRHTAALVALLEGTDDRRKGGRSPVLTRARGFVAHRRGGRHVLPVG